MFFRSVDRQVYVYIDDIQLFAESCLAGKKLYE